MTAAATSTKTYACAVCGKRSRPDKMVYSTFTGARYCGPVDEAACKRRARRATRLLRQAVAEQEARA